MSRAARVSVDLFVTGALFVPFALAVFALRSEGAAPSLAHAALLLPLLLLPVWALRRLRGLKRPTHEPTLFD